MYEILRKGRVIARVRTYEEMLKIVKVGDSFRYIIEERED